MSGTIVQLKEASRWYGNVIALNNLTLDVPPGLIGLVGPNGAGKTTLLRLITGQIRPSGGSVEVFGQPIWGNVTTRRKLGYCPEHDHFYEELTGLEFVATLTHLYGFSKNDAHERAVNALNQVKLDEQAYRYKPISDYSKGMRQKVKVAQSLAHDPELLILDEPFTGVDALSRHHLAELLRNLGNEGRTVFLSSHVLHEVEQVTNEFILIDSGRLVAQGNVSEIRNLIDEHPHQIQVHCKNASQLAAALIEATAGPIGVNVESDRVLVIHTPTPNACYDLLPQVAVKHAIPLFRVTSPDNNLEAVFRYLTRV